MLHIARHERHVMAQRDGSDHQVEVGNPLQHHSALRRARDSVHLPSK